MVDYSSVSIPRPLDWQAFERCCRVLFECLLNDPQTNLHGRSGQPQHGVDVYGRRDGDSARWVGVQCKGKEGDYQGNVTEDELEREVAKARGFSPALSEFFLVTTAPNDAKLQKRAREITAENARNGRPLPVTVWGWNDLQARIAEHPRAMQAFHPDLTPFSVNQHRSRPPFGIKLNN